MEFMLCYVHRNQRSIQWTADLNVCLSRMEKPLDVQLFSNWWRLIFVKSFSKQLCLPMFNQFHGFFIRLPTLLLAYLGSLPGLCPKMNWILLFHRAAQSMNYRMFWMHSVSLSFFVQMMPLIVLIFLCWLYRYATKRNQVWHNLLNGFRLNSLS